MSEKKQANLQLLAEVIGTQDLHYVDTAASDNLTSCRVNFDSQQAQIYGWSFVPKQDARDNKNLIISSIIHICMSELRLIHF